jgi:hypothetical protein
MPVMIKSNCVTHSTVHVIAVSADREPRSLHVFVGPWSKFSDSGRAQDFMKGPGRLRPKAAPNR